MAQIAQDSGGALPPPPLVPPPNPMQVGRYMPPPVAQYTPPTGFLGGLNSLVQQTIAPVQQDVQGKLADLRSLLGGPHSDYFNSPEATANALAMFSLTRAGSGGLADIHVPGQAVAGAKAAGSAAADELAAQAAKVPSLESGFLAGESGGAKLPGGNGPKNAFSNFTDEQLTSHVADLQSSADRSKAAYADAKARLKNSPMTNSAQVQDTGASARGNAMALNAAKKEATARGISGGDRGLPPDMNAATLSQRIGVPDRAPGQADFAAQQAKDIASRTQKAAVSPGFTVKELAPNIHQVITPSGGDGPIFNGFNGFKGDTKAAAQAAADKLNATAGPNIASASAAFNTATGLDRTSVLLADAAKALPPDLKAAVRVAIRGDGIQSLDPAVQAQLGQAIQNELRVRGLPPTPENVQGISNNLLSEATKVNKISRTNGRVPTPQEVAADGNTAAVKQAVSEATAPVPGSTEALDTVPGAEAAPTTTPEGPAINPPGLRSDQPSPNLPPAPSSAEPLLNRGLREVMGLARASLVLGHLGFLRQELGGLTYATSRGRLDIVGNSMKALGRGIASDTPTVAKDIAGMNQSLAEAGLVGKGLKTPVFINKPNGHISQAEETLLVGNLVRNPGATAAAGAANGFIGADPNSTTQDRLQRAAEGAAIGAAFGLAGPKLNQGYAMGINQLRTDLALAMAKSAAKTGLADPVTGRLIGSQADKIGSFVNILTGRGDLVEKLASKAGPDAVEAAKAIQNAASGIFFGPRLMTSTWQQAANTIAAIHGIVPDTIGALRGGKALEQTRLATIQSTASLVAFGAGAMKLAQVAGLSIGTDPNKSDWGTIHLPDGAKVDMWGPFRTFARDIAQALIYTQQSLPTAIGGGGLGPTRTGPFAKTPATIGGDYLRSHLNPPAGVAVDYASGQTAIGQPPSLDPINPAKNMPFGVSTAQYAFGQGNPHMPAGPGGALGAGETALTALGAGVQPPTLTPPRDGLGRVDDGALPATPVTDAWAAAQTANPKLGALAAPNRNILPGIALDDKETDAYRTITGDARSALMSQVVSSPGFQSANPTQQEKLLVGAKNEADRQAKVTFALQAAKTAVDDNALVRAATIGERASVSTGQKMDFVTQLSQANTLNPTVQAAIDDMRTQTDPLKPKYELSVAELQKGSALVSQYLAAPAYRVGTTQDWTDAAKQGAALHATYQSLLAEAVQKSTATRKVPVTALPDYQHYIKDWATARTSTGRPVSAFITKTGTIDTKLVSPQRLAITKDPLFTHFSAVASQRDPYSVKGTTTP